MSKKRQGSSEKLNLNAFEEAVAFLIDNMLNIIVDYKNKYAIEVECRIFQLFTCDHLFAVKQVSHDKRRLLFDIFSDYIVEKYSRSCSDSLDVNSLINNRMLNYSRTVNQESDSIFSNYIDCFWCFVYFSGIDKPDINYTYGKSRRPLDLLMCHQVLLVVKAYLEGTNLAFHKYIIGLLESGAEIVRTKSLSKENAGSIVSDFNIRLSHTLIPSIFFNDKRLMLKYFFRDFKSNYSQILNRANRDFYNGNISISVEYHEFNSSDGPVYVVDFGKCLNTFECWYHVFKVQEQAGVFRRRRIGFRYFTVERNVEGDYMLCEYQTAESHINYGKVNYLQPSEIVDRLYTFN